MKFRAHFCSKGKGDPLPSATTLLCDSSCLEKLPEAFEEASSDPSAFPQSIHLYSPSLTPEL